MLNVQVVEKFVKGLEGQFDEFGKVIVGEKSTPLLIEYLKECIMLQKAVEEVLPRGVSYQATTGRYQASGQSHGKRVFLYAGKNKQAAIEARQAWEAGECLRDSQVALASVFPTYYTYKETIKEVV